MFTQLSILFSDKLRGPVHSTGSSYAGGRARGARRPLLLLWVVSVPLQSTLIAQWLSLQCLQITVFKAG